MSATISAICNDMHKSLSHIDIMCITKYRDNREIPMALTLTIGEGSHYHLKAWKSLCPSPQSFYRQVHGKSHARPTSYRTLVLQRHLCVKI